MKLLNRLSGSSQNPRLHSLDFADTFFRDRYGHRALFRNSRRSPRHGWWNVDASKSLRGLQRGNGHKIHELLAEAENERKHLMFFMEVVHPSILEIYHHYCARYLLALLSCSLHSLSEDCAPWRVTSKSCS